ncbi:hypothetical protein HYV83_05420 [Candidatus Woesearchaeota archaeon]|nr:hypothetical protein [Candidatus Woesearchaeota archaeon]
MRDELFEEGSFRALSEISEAIERGFLGSELARMVSDDGTTQVLPGLKRYIALVVSSFTDGKRVLANLDKWYPVLSEHAPKHMNVVVQNVNAGDFALVRGMVKKGSVDELAAQVAVAYGTAAGMLRHVGVRGETFGYMSVRARPLVESMGAIGIELELVPKSPEVFNPLRFEQYISTQLSRN